MYPNSNASDIGNLLRLIQEEKASSVLNQPPGAQPSAPVRGVVQQPLQSPNDPGSSRMISTPPEAGGVVAPVAPVTPAPSTTPGNAIPTGTLLSNPVAPRSPVAPVPMPAPTPAQPTSSPKIGTSILAASTKAPTANIVNKANVVNKPTPTPTPTPQNTTAQNQNLVNQILSIFKSIFSTHIGSPSVTKPGPTPKPKQFTQGVTG